MNRGTLSKLNRMVDCGCCGKRTHSSVESVGIDMCRLCYESASMENAHNDTNGRDCNHLKCPVHTGVSCMHELLDQKGETKMKTKDAPPTLPMPKAKITGPAARVSQASPHPVAKAPSGDRRQADDRRNLTKAKPDFKAIKARAKAARPPVKMTVGVTNGEKYNFTKEPFDTVKEALTALDKVLAAKHGKGLREVILSFHG